jgi:uncharacterized protein DUF5985
VADITYALCALMAFFCAWLLLQAYRQRSITFLLWSGLFFAIQACNNLFLVLDKLVFPNIDLSLYRYAVALIANAILLYGLIMRTEVN